MFALPVTLGPAFVAWAVAAASTRRSTAAHDDGRDDPARVRRLTLVRTGWREGRGRAPIEWRWTPTAEERFWRRTRRSRAARAAAASTETPAQPVAAAPEDTRCACSTRRQRRPHLGCDQDRTQQMPEARSRQPGLAFAGPRRDSVVRGVRIETDWSRITARRDVAAADRPGLVVVRGRRRSSLHAGTARRRRDRRLLQGEHRRAGLAAPRRRALLRVEWRRRVRAGRRRCSNGRVYALGATGILNALDAGTGARRLVAQRGGRHRRDRCRAGALRARRWSSTTSSSSRPRDARRLRLATGEPRLDPRPAAAATARRISSTIDGVTQILLLSRRGATSVSPADGARALGARVGRRHRHRAARVHCAMATS